MLHCRFPVLLSRETNIYLQSVRTDVATVERLSYMIIHELLAVLFDDILNHLRSYLRIHAALIVPPHHLA